MKTIISAVFLFINLVGNATANKTFNQNTDQSFTLIGIPSYNYKTNTNLTSSGININYTLNANGAETTSVIKYRSEYEKEYTKTKNGLETANKDSVAGGISIIGLLAGTTYYCIIEAKNRFGVAQTQMTAFTTASDAPEIKNISSIKIGQTSTTVAYDLNCSSADTKTFIYFGTSVDNLDKITIAPFANSNNSKTFSVALLGLTFNTTYYFQISANTDSFSTISNIYSFTTPAPNAITSPKNDIVVSSFSN